MTEAWRQQVLPRFDGAASHYDGEANLQSVIAERLASLCMQQPIPAGLWVDLGSGTGLLADALERQCPGQQVLRLDGSQAMLSQQGQQPSVLAFDLNNPLPHWPAPPTWPSARTAQCRSRAAFTKPVAAVAASTADTCTVDT